MTAALTRSPLPVSANPNTTLKSQAWFMQRLRETFAGRSGAWLPAHESRTLQVLAKEAKNLPLTATLRVSSPALHPLSMLLAQSVNAEFLGETGSCPLLDIDQIAKPGRRERSYSLMSSELDRLLRKRRLASEQGNSNEIVWKSQTFCLEIVLSDQFCGLMLGNQVHYGPSAWFLAICDMFRCRVTTLRLNRLLRKINPKRLEEMWDWADSINLVSNLGYTVTKGIESLSKCWLSHISGGDLEGGQVSYDRMAGKLGERLEKVAAAEGVPEPKQWSAVKIGEFRNMLERCSITETVEIFGCQKSIGYPFVSTLACGRSVREASGGAGKGNMVNFKRNEWLVCHMILKNVIARTGSWPLLLFRDDSLLLKTFHDQEIPSLEDGSYPLSDWADTEFTKIYDFEVFEDYLPFLTDKACTPPFSVLKEKYEGKPGDSADFRLIASVLKASSFESQRALNEYFEYLNDPTALRDVVREFEKNGEFKTPAARGFGILPPSRRLALGIIQENVKRNIFSDLPYQTMTMSRTEQQHSLWESVKPSSSKAVVFIEIDYSQWNNKFRGFQVRNVGKRFDQLHGVSGVFGRIHEYFSKSLLVTWAPNSRITALEYSEREQNSLHFADDSSDTGHQGGIEGLAQAEWTAMTMAMVYEALKGESAEFTLLGQGDNQVLRITFSDLDSTELGEISIRTRRIMNRINLVAAGLDHDAKPDEFVESTSVLTYSKQVFVNGSEVPTDLKYGGKISPMASVETPSLGESIGAIFSSCSTASERSHDPALYWLFAAEQTFHFLEEVRAQPFTVGHQLVRYLSTMSDEQKLLAVCLPSSLGGFPVVPLSGFLVRGEPDSLGAAVASCRRLSHQLPVMRKVFDYLDRDVAWRTDLTGSSFEALIEDPESVPLKKPSGSKIALRNLAAEVVRETTANRDFRELFSRSHELDPLVKQWISGMRPFLPYLATELYKASLPGVAATIEQKYVMTRTMISKARAPASVNSHLIEKEVGSLRAVFAIFHNVTLCDPKPVFATSYDLCNRYRDRWPGLRGESMGVTNCHPFDFSVSTDITRSGIKILDSLGTGSVTGRGKSPPFIGSVTVDRKTEKMFDVKQTRGVDTLKHLVVAWTAVSGDLGVKDMMNQILGTRTSVTLDDALPFLPRTQGGSAAHRYAGGNRNMSIGVIGSMNVASHYSFLTDDIPGISASKVDRPLPFQHFFGLLNTWARYRLLGGQRGPGLVYLVDDCSVPRLPEEALTLEVRPDLPRLKRTTLRSPFLRIDPIELYKIDTDFLLAGVSMVPPDPSTKAGQRRLLTSLFFNGLMGMRGSSIDALVELSGGEKKSSWIGVSEFAYLDPSIVYESATSAGTLICSDLVLRDRYSSLTLDERMREAALEVAAALVDRLQPILCSSALGKGPLSLHQGLDEATKDALDRKKYALARTIYDQARNPWMFPIPDLEILPFGRGSDIKPIHWYSRLGSYGLLVMGMKASQRGFTGPGEKDILQEARAVYSTLRQILHAATRARNNVVQILHACRVLLDQVVGIFPLEDQDSLRRSFGVYFQIHRAKAYSVTPSEAVRSLRAGNPVLTPDVYNLEAAGSVRWFSEARVPSMVSPQLPDTIVEFGQDSHPSLEVLLSSRNGRVFGYHTTIMSGWLPVLRSLLRAEVSQADRPVVVVGTGSGAIQASLAFLGRRSTGIDLSHTIPRRVIASACPAPPEVLAFNQGALASYDLEAYRLGGDFFDPGLATHVKKNYSTIIVDVETGQADSTRKVIAVTTSLLGPWKTVLVKLIITFSEASEIFGYWRSCDGVASVQVCCMSSCHHDSHKSVYLFLIRATGQVKRAAVVTNVYRLAGHSRVEPDWLSTGSFSGDLELLLLRSTRGTLALWDSKADIRENLANQLSLTQSAWRKTRFQSSKVKRRYEKRVTRMEDYKNAIDEVLSLVESEPQTWRFVEGLAYLVRSAVKDLALANSEKERIRRGVKLAFFRKWAMAWYSLIRITGAEDLSCLQFSYASEDPDDESTPFDWFAEMSK